MIGKLLQILVSDTNFQVLSLIFHNYLFFSVRAAAMIKNLRGKMRNNFSPIIRNEPKLWFACHKTDFGRRIKRREKKEGWKKLNSSLRKFDFHAAVWKMLLNFIRRGQTFIKTVTTRPGNRFQLGWIFIRENMYLFCKSRTVLHRIPLLIF